jgi:hypothetical protein
MFLAAKGLQQRPALSQPAPCKPYAKSNQITLSIKQPWGRGELCMKLRPLIRFQLRGFFLFGLTHLADAPDQATPSARVCLFSVHQFASRYPDIRTKEKQSNMVIGE